MNKTVSTQTLGKKSKEVSEKTKEKIIKAALRVFSREGFSDARLRDIADRAGTTHSLIRHHFGSKEDLWKVVVDYGLKLREDNLKQIIESGQGMDPVDLYKMTIRSHILFAAENVELAGILLHNPGRSRQNLDYIIEKQKRIHDIVAPLFKATQARGYFKGFDHESFTIYMRALVESPIANWELTNRLLKDDIRSEKGITLHAQRVIGFLFRKDE